MRKTSRVPGPVSPALVRLLSATTCLLWLGLNSFAIGQGTLEDYRRADSLRQRTSGKVFRDRVSPHWFSEGQRFWYRVDVGPRQHRFIMVDAESGVRKEAFDHDAVARALSGATGESLSAMQLPLEQLEFPDESTVRFQFGGRVWEHRTANGETVAMDGADAEPQTTVRILRRPQNSRRGDAETSMRFENRIAHAFDLFWISDSGERRKYATVGPGETHSQHTYAGHVWLAQEPDGTLLGVYEALRTPGRAVIDGSWPAGAEARESPRRGAPQRERTSRERSPDGRWSARIVDCNVVLRRLEDDAETVLTTDGVPEDPYTARFFWAPDSTKLVVIRETPAERREVTLVESAPDEQLQPKVHTYDYAKPGDAIAHPRPCLFDVEAAQQIPVRDDLFPNPWSLSEYYWAPDSSRFSFLYNERGHQTLRLLSIDASSGDVSTVIEETSPTFICYSSKLFLRRLDETREIIWMSERDGWNHLYLYDAASGVVKNQITSGEWVIREVDRIDPEARQIWFQAGGIHEGEDPYYVHYCRINFDGSGLTLLTEGDGTHEVEFSPGREFLIDRWSRVDQPPVTELRRTSDGSLVCQLEEADWSRLLETGWRAPERFVAKGRDGETDIYGVIYRPSNFDPERKYPVLEQIYAGPQSAHVPKEFASHHGPQSMAELGFVVVQIDGMGTSHRSKAFHDICWKDLGDAGLPDRVLWMKAAARERPWMDLTRVGIYGGSAGGQNAMRALITHGDFYKAAAADCGCHDNRMDKIWWNEQWMGWPVDDSYPESSNVEQAHRMQGKLLLIVGELDRNVDPASTMQVVDALVKADKDFELLVMPGTGHGAAGTRYATRRQRDFFVRSLMGVEPRVE